MRVRVETTGRRAHSARSWLGENAIHKAAPVLARLAAYEPRQVPIDGLLYREGLNAVLIDGGHATNVIPDCCAVTVNYRFAPDRSEAEALAHVAEVFDGFEVVLTDSAPGALPGLSHPSAVDFVQALGLGRPPRTAGPTSPASPRSACPRSTTGPVTRSWPTRARSMSRSRRCWRPRRSCAHGFRRHARGMPVTRN